MLSEVKLNLIQNLNSLAKIRVYLSENNGIVVVVVVVCHVNNLFYY